MPTILHDNRRKRNIIKMLQKESGLSNQELAARLNMKTAVFCNKLNRDSFTFEQMYDIAKICGHEIVLLDIYSNEISHLPNYNERWKEYD